MFIKICRKNTHTKLNSQPGKVHGKLKAKNCHFLVTISIENGRCLFEAMISFPFFGFKL